MLNFRGNLKKCSVSSLLNEPITDILDIGYLVHLSTFSIQFVGSCDGLICLAIDREDLILWNPSTRIRKKLPEFGVKSIGGFSYFACGFGYDESSDDYKVLCSFASERSLSDMIVKVYSLKKDEWKMIKNFKDGGLIGNASTFVDGKLHWIEYPELGSECCTFNIVSLDLQTEEYRIVEMPDYVKGKFSTRLGESEGRLFVFCNQMNNGDVWMMDDYGVGKETWTKVVTIPYIDDFLKNNYVHVLYVLKNGQLLLICGLKFVVFNPKDCNFRYPVVINVGEFVGAVTYFESLVSPVG